MCLTNMPLGLTLLHALRLGAVPRPGERTAWLALNGIDGAAATLDELGELLAGNARLASPGASFPRPHEQALLTALARVDHDPEQADCLLEFLPEKSRMRGIALLTELSRKLRADLSKRLRHPPMKQATPREARPH